MEFARIIPPKALRTLQNKFLNHAPYAKYALCEKIVKPSRIIPK